MSNQLRRRQLPVLLAAVLPVPLPGVLGQTVYTGDDVVAIILDASTYWGLDASQMLRIAWCESRYDPSAYNRRSGASGLFQFIPGTWARAVWALGWPPDPGSSPFDPYANTEAACWLMKTEGPRHWVCR